MDQRWVKDATDIDKDGSGDVSKESEDDEDIKALRYELLNQSLPHLYFILYAYNSEEPSSIWKARYQLIPTLCKSLLHLEETYRSESQTTYRARLYKSRRGPTSFR